MNWKKVKEVIAYKGWRQIIQKTFILPNNKDPEGAIDKGESVLAAAARELEEETGYSAKKIVLLKEFRMSYRVDRQISVLALDCKKVSQQKLDSTEFIEIYTLPIEKFQVLLTNTADDSFTNVGTGFLALNYLFSR